MKASRGDRLHWGLTDFTLPPMLVIIASWESVLDWRGYGTATVQVWYIRRRRRRMRKYRSVQLFETLEYEQRVLCNLFLKKEVPTPHSPPKHNDIGWRGRFSKNLVLDDLILLTEWVCPKMLITEVGIPGTNWHLQCPGFRLISCPAEFVLKGTTGLADNLSDMDYPEL